MGSVVKREGAPVTLANITEMTTPMQSITRDSAAEVTPSQESATQRKRRPTENDAAATAKRPRQARRHEGWWHLDGSVILELCGVMFRLYRWQLARKSPFFEKLFAQPPVDAVDDCPLYVLDRGSPEDFAALLKALEDGLSNVYITARPAFKDIIPVLRMSTFYEFRHAREWAVTNVTYYFPSGLEDAIHCDGDEPVDALLLARECNVTELLKGCLYELFARPACDAHRLPPADLQRLLDARSNMQHRWVAEVARAPVMECPEDAISDTKINCRNSKLRKRDLAYAWAKIAHTPKPDEQSIFEEGLLNPICALATLADADWAKHKFCKRCAVAMEEKWTNMRKAWWDDLDALFGLKE